MPPSEVVADGEAETLRRLESELADVAPPMYVDVEADAESNYEIESVVFAWRMSLAWPR